MQHHSKEDASQKSRFRLPSNLSAKVVAAVILIWTGFLITMIVTQGSDIGTPASETEAVIRSNERLLQMAQWTIATVLTIGGALIGFNWFQNQRERESIEASRSDVVKVIESLPGTIDELTETIEQRLQLLERAVQFTHDATVGVQMLEEAKQLS